MHMTDWTKDENQVLLAGGSMGGEYLDSIGRTDLATLSADQWLTFLQCVGAEIARVTMNGGDVWQERVGNDVVTVFRNFEANWDELPEPKFSLPELLKFLPAEVLEVKKHLMPNAKVSAVRPLNTQEGDPLPW